MATFRIGQRVRVVRAYGSQISLGRAATVVGGLTPGQEGDGRTYMGYPIDIDGIGVFNRHGSRIVAHTYDIEPIVDDGRKVVSWSECLWQPSHEGVAA